MTLSPYLTWRWWATRQARQIPSPRAPSALVGRPQRVPASISSGTADRGLPESGVDCATWQVLLNYRQADEPYCVGAMHDFLAERFGADRIFRDCRSLRPGEDYSKLILDVIRQADALVVVIGPQWLSLADEAGIPLLRKPKDWVRREIELALRLRKKVLPVLLDGVQMPVPAALPREIAELSSLTALPVSHRRLREDFEALAEGLIDLVPTLGR